MTLIRLLISLNRQLVPVARRNWIAIILLGLGTSIATVLGYLLLAMLMQSMLQQSNELIVGWVSLSTGVKTYLAVLLASVSLLIIAIQLDFLRQKQAIALQRALSVEAAIQGVQQLLSRKQEIRLKRAIREITGPVAFACGFSVARSALMSVDLLQLGIYLLIMVWLEPKTLFIILLIGLLAASKMSRSLSRVSLVVQEKTDQQQQARQSQDQLLQSLRQGDLDSHAMRNELQEMYDNGAMGRSLESKLDIRLEKRLAPLYMSYLFPILLILFPLSAYLVGYPPKKLGNLVILLLLLRLSVGILQQLSGKLISIATFQPALICFVKLSSGTQVDSCQFSNAQQVTDDDDTDGS